MKKNYVVFVDDETALHDIVRYDLKKEIRAGLFVLECFENGLLCYNFIKEHIDNINILLVITDIKMPEMNGFELAEKLRTEFPNLRFAITSANTDKATIHKALSAGAIDFYGKPIDFDKVKAAISEKLGGSI